MNDQKINKNKKFTLATDSSCCDSATQSSASTSCCDAGSSQNSSCYDSNSQQQSESSCCSSDAPTTNGSSSCGCSSEPKEEIKNVDVDYNITIDGKEVHVDNASKNIVEIAKSAGIAIPAPCFLAKKKKGCCMSCVIEADEEQTYACNTHPKEGMNIVVNRDDLKALRKERLIKYQAASKSGAHLKCGEV